MADLDFDRLRELRAHRPEAVAEACARRSRRRVRGASGRLMLIAADHTARGMLSLRDRPLAMADRYDLLSRVVTALDRPGIDGRTAEPGDSRLPFYESAGRMP